MSEVLVAWAAGLFEGEGSCFERGRATLRVQLAMSREESVRRFAGVAGVGKVYGPYEHNGRDGHQRKPRWMFVAEGKEAASVMDLLEPWLSDWRRRKT